MTQTPRDNARPFFFFDWFYAAIFVLAAIFAINVRNILIFAIQDHLHAPLSQAFFFSGTAYASALAYILVFGTIFSGFILFERSTLAKNTALFSDRIRAFWLGAGFYLSCFFMLIVLAQKLVGFFSGDTQTTAQIYDTLLTLAILGLTALYFLLGTRSVTCVLSKAYTWIVIGVTGFFMLLAFALTMHYAPPSQVKKALAEARDAQALSRIKWKAQAFFKQNKRFPATLSELAARHPEEHFAKHEKVYTYAMTGKSALRVSVPLSTQLKVRRHFPLWSQSNDKKQAFVEIKPNN